MKLYLKCHKWIRNSFEYVEQFMEKINLNIHLNKIYTQVRNSQISSVNHFQNDERADTETE